MTVELESNANQGKFLSYILRQRLPLTLCENEVTSSYK